MMISGFMRVLRRRLSLILFQFLTFSAICLIFFAMSSGDVGLHLVPRFDDIALRLNSCAWPPLRWQVFSWRFVSADGAAGFGSPNIPVSVSGRLADVGRPTMPVVSQL
jgi:hypothetical protein